MRHREVTAKGQLWRWWWEKAMQAGMRGKETWPIGKGVKSGIFRVSVGEVVGKEHSPT